MPALYVPLLPVVTSLKSLLGSPYSMGNVCVAPLSVVSPASTRPSFVTAIMPAHSGQARLVPPTPANQPPEYVSSTQTPVAGSASAATSGTLRFVVLAWVAPLIPPWKVGSVSYWLIPPPVS